MKPGMNLTKTNKLREIENTLIEGLELLPYE